MGGGKCLFGAVFAGALVVSGACTAGEIVCPRTLSLADGPKDLPLTFAEVWAGHQQLAFEDAEDHKVTRRRLWARWHFASAPLPRFLLCSYGREEAIPHRRAIVIPVPPGAQPCEMDIRGGRHTDILWTDISTFTCAGFVSALPRFHVAGRPTRVAELGGLNLAMTREAVTDSVRRRGGTIAGSADRMEVTVDGRAYVVRFRLGADTPSSITAVFPSATDDGRDVFLDGVFRFGTPDGSWDDPYHHWEGADGTWATFVEGGAGRPHELHLMDHPPPKEWRDFHDGTREGAPREP
ncbi:MAG: hypothetical protein ACM31L_13885 [Actinomycetota bacterium]